MTADRERFLERWSRRKAAARTDADEQAKTPESAKTPEPAAADAAVENPEDLTDAELLEKLKLPDPDQMAPGDDFAAFMRDGIPARLRNRALRKLWLTDPTLANLDQLVDYGGDFTDAATVVEGMQTLYQVGRGLAAPEAERETTGAPGADTVCAEGAEDANVADAKPADSDPAGSTQVDSDQVDSGQVDSDPADAEPAGAPPSAQAAADPGDGEAEAEADPCPESESRPDPALVVPIATTQRRRRMAFRFE